MRKFLSIVLVVLTIGGVFFARSGPQGSTVKQQKEAERKIVNTKSDIMAPIAPGDSAIYLVGNVAAQHNGAVITCDSAVRYSDMRIVFFGNVLINKNTTYIYGDRAEYDGERNEAHVYSDLIKVVDGDATLYTYKFMFNTNTNVGLFDDRGVMINRDSRLESVRGYYYGDQKELICVDQVQMRNEEYELKGDSVIYNMDTDNAYFFTRTNIWSNEGDYLYADKGEYQKADSLYIVRQNGYVLTEKQEMWSDSIDYYRIQEHVILRNNIQIDDTEHKTLAFGDYGEYWKHPGNALLTRRPSVVSYDLSQGDSVFMRADSMFVYTILKGQAIDSAALAATTPALEGQDSDIPQTAGEAPLVSTGTPRSDGGSNTPSADGQGTPDAADSVLRSIPDSLAAKAAADSVQLTPAEQKARLKAAAKKAAAERKAAAAKVKKEKLAQIAAKRKTKAVAKFKEQSEREQKQLKIMRLRAEAKLRARQLRAQRKGRSIEVDSTQLRTIDRLIERAVREQDSLRARAADTLGRDSLAGRDSLDSLPNPADTMYRLLKGYRNVRIFRSDFQAVCDSMTAISTDSTIHLYINPVLWNENNQITSDVMDIYTKNQQIVRAEFVGSPMMVSELDTTHYNQIAGKSMTAFFRDNEIYRNDVNGNVQTIYYMQDGEPPVITGMSVVESGNASFHIENKQVVRIVYRIDPSTGNYPVEKVPAEQEPYLKGFKWEGKRRPTQADVFDRVIRPSERERRSRLPKPDFPILFQVEDYKKRLIEQRRWADRNDHVDEQTIEWMRELGYSVGQPRESGPKF